MEAELNVRTRGGDSSVLRQEARMAVRKKSPTAPRSKKAGRPPVESASSPQVGRRRKSAGAAVSKGTTVMQSDKGARAAWSAAKPMWKKR